MILVTVDYRDDEPTRLRGMGLLTGGAPPSGSSIVASTCTNCSTSCCTFVIDCDDGDPCTTDSCDFQIGDPFGTGCCVNAPVADGLPGNCSDGVFCNGEETCEGGQCQAALPVLCPLFGGVREVCMESFGVCDSYSYNAGAPCFDDATCIQASGSSAPFCDRCRHDCRERLCNDGQTLCLADGDCPAVTGRCNNAARECTVNTDCPGGACTLSGAGTCLTNNQLCDDSNYCNGVESCNMSTGVCLAGLNPCGHNADCFYKKCAGGALNGADCNIDANCPGGLCRINMAGNNPASATCFFGRCCSVVTEPACSKSNLAACSSQGREWYAGDGGRQTTEVGQNCGGFNPEVPVADAWGCPKYSSGISQSNLADAPAYLETIGPISDSPANVSIGSFTGPLNSVGDDYAMTNASHFGLDVLRFVGGLIVPNRIAIEFYDSAGNLIEDTVLPPIAGTGQQTIIVAFNPELILPPQGFVVWRIAGNYSPNAQMFIMSTDDVDTGTNNSNVLWRNGASVVNFLPNGAPGYLSFELVGDKAAAPAGACCDTTTGDCNAQAEWVCRGEGGNFQAGLPCAQCVNGINAGAPCRTCSGGANDGNPCDGSSECPGGACVADPGICNTGLGTCSNDNEAVCTSHPECTGIPGRCSNSIGLCTTDAQCPGGTCGGSGTCLQGTCQTADCSVGGCCITATGECEPNHGPASCASADGTFQGFGSNCDNNCCIQPVYTGADHAASATLHMIAVPAPGADPVTITITGDNSEATSTAQQPDTCFGPATMLGDDPGWWERFEIDACANVRIDLCCTFPIHEPAWTFLAGDVNCNTTYSNENPPNHFAESANGRGAPYCSESNLWQWYRALPAGIYYYPVYAAPSGHVGPYQLHITAEACPVAACCLPNGTCQDGLTQAGCDAANGIFLAPPQRSPAEESCSAGICDQGACCTAPGECADARENSGNPMTKVICEGAGFNGLYVPNLLCSGGRCAVDDLSCDDDIDCDFNGPCLGDAEQRAQPNPCRICEHISDATCQHDPGAFEGVAYLADISSTISPTRIAEDVLVTSTGTLQEICVIGVYVYFPVGPAADCSTLPDFGDLTDEFRVRVYEIDSTTNYVPGVLLGEYSTIIAENEATPEFTDGGFPFFRHQLSLVPGTDPLPILQQDEIYFVEIANNTIGSDPGCNWFWLNAEETEGNDIFFQELGTNYTVADAEADDSGSGSGDVSICMNVPFTNPPTPIRACCTCDQQDPCRDTDLADCIDIGGEWMFDTLSCTAPDFLCTAPANDTCENASVVSDGFRFWDNFCANLDGPTGSNCNDENVSATNDGWYHYTASCSGTLTVSLCDPLNDYVFDSAAYIYRNTSTPTVCSCPAEPGFAEVECNDDACGGFGMSGEVQAPVVAGHCYTIRVAGNGNVGSNYDGYGKLRITCGDAVCGDNSRDAGAGEQCDGTDDSLCPGECSVDCICPVPPCGDNIAVTQLGEPCDGTDDSACPSQCRPPGHPLGGCTCAPPCGNDLREAGEICDGSDANACPGQCIPPGFPEPCTCQGPCGNNTFDCNNNETPDGCDILECAGAPACGDCNQNGIPDACDIAAATSADTTPMDGVPDECSFFVAACNPPSDEWSCVENWLPIHKEFPNNDGPTTYALMLVGQDDVCLDVDVTIDALALVDGASLRVTQPDPPCDGGGAGPVAFTVAEPGGLLVEGMLTVAGSNEITVLGPATVGPEGLYAAAENATSTVDASLAVGDLRILGDECDVEPCDHGGRVELTDTMSLTVNGDLIIDGSLTDGECDFDHRARRRHERATTGSVAMRSFHTPPVKITRDATTIGILGSMIFLGAAGSINESSIPITLGGDFDNQSTRPDCFDWTSGKLVLDGDTQNFEVAAIDEGPLDGRGVLAPYYIAELTVAAGSHVTFRDTFDNNGSGQIPCTEALYVGTLNVEANASVTLAHCRVYATEIVLHPTANIFYDGCAALNSGEPLGSPAPVAAEFPAVNKVRHISFVVPSGGAGVDTALRVELTSLHHPASPPPGTPDFTAFEGQFRYVNSFGGSTLCVDSATFLTNYRCGTLGCQPEYHDWATELSAATNPASPAGLIHVTGDSVVPSSTLTVNHIAASCGAAPAANTCAAASAGLAVSTSRWGDVAGSGGGPPDGIQNVIDIGSVVDNVKGIPTAIPERRAWMKNPPNIFGNPVNVIDIGLTVDSVKGFPYPYTISACP